MILLYFTIGPCEADKLTKYFFLASWDAIEAMWVRDRVSHCTNFTDATLVIEDNYWGLYWCDSGDWWYLLVMEVDKVVDEVAKVEVDKVADMVVKITVKDFTDLHFTLAMQK